MEAGIDGAMACTCCFLFHGLYDQCIDRYPGIQ